jgi:phasin
VGKADSKAKANTDTPKAEVDTNEKRNFDGSLFAMPDIFRGIAEQGMVRTKDSYEKLQAASGELADILSETYSTHARTAADCGIKVIEIASANTNSAFDFLSKLMDTKSLSEIVHLSATQSRKHFEATSAQNKELWQLAQKVATETAEPIKKGLTRVLQKAS